MRVYLILLSTFFTTLIFGQYSLDWAVSFGATSGGLMQSPRSITVDSNGNTYVCGAFKHIVDFDPGIGVAAKTSKGGWDIFVQKLDSLGNLVWIQTMGSTSTLYPGLQYDQARDISLDAFGNLYVVGSFDVGSVDFNSGPGISNLVCASWRDPFVLKLKASDGSFIWAKSFASTASSSGLASDVSVDKKGNVIVAGQYSWGALDFDPGPSTLNYTSNGQSDIFVVKLDSNGNLIWANSIGGNNSDRVADVKTDNSGNICLFGFFQDTVDFDPGIGVNKLSDSNGKMTFVLKLTESGSLRWVKQIASSNPSALDIDNHNNIALVGNFFGTQNFSPDTSVFNLSSKGSGDIFIEKLDSSGRFLWAKAIGGINSDDAKSIKFTSDGSILFAGEFSDTVDFNPDTGIFLMTSNRHTDLYIEKLDGQGNFEFVKPIIGGQYDIFLELDHNDNLFATGQFSGITDFDLDTSVFNLTGRGGSDIFVFRHNSCKTYFVDTHIACDSYTWINGVTYRSSNSTAKDTLVNSKGCDSIVSLDLTINQSSTSVDTHIACDSYTWINGVTYRSSNSTAKDTLVNSKGCDSIVSLDLAINQSSTSVDTHIACDSYTWINGVTYRSSNSTAKDTLVNSKGCDSIVSLDLAINQSSTSVDTHIACDSYTWINGVTYRSSNSTAKDTLVNSKGCDSIVSLDLTINQSSTSVDTHIACDSYTWINGVTYRSSNSTAKDTLVNSKGCDSIITLNLTVNRVNVGVSQVGITLSSQALGSLYQWIDCDNGNGIIPGETSASYTPLRNGNYAVIVTQNSCIDTSICKIINSVGLVDNTLKNENVFLYPNPTTGILFIKVNKNFSKVKIEVRDVTGRIIDEINYRNSGVYPIEIRNPKGFYLIEITLGFEKVVFKVIKQ